MLIEQKTHMNMTLNIGDKVRFLNDVGGGTVAGFQRGGIVLVEDADGFEIPVREQEVVLVSSSESRLTREPVREEPEEQEEPVYRVKTILASKGAASSPTYERTAPEQKHTPTPSNEAAPVSLEERIAALERKVKHMQQRIEQLEAGKTLREHLQDSGFKITESIKHKVKEKKDDLLEIDLHAEELLETTAGMDASAIKEYQLDVFRRTMQENMKNKGQRIVFIHGNGDGVLRRAILSELQRSYKHCQWQDASFQQYGFGATMVTIR